MKILLIDEDAFIIDLYLRVIEQEKIEVVAAHDTKSAEEMMQKMDTLPDAILMETKMSYGDGIEFIQKVKSDPRSEKIPIIILTNLYSREDQKKGLEAGADAYMIKSQHEPKEVVAQLKSLTNG